MALAKDNENPKEEIDQAQKVFLREVDDAVREQDLQNFVQRYGLMIGAVIVVGLASLAGWIFYSNSQTEQAGLRSEEYVAAVESVRQNNLDGAATALVELETADQDGYRAAAQLLQAAIALEKDDPKKAIDGYAKVAADESLPQPFRELALIRQTATEFDDLEPQQVVDRLKVLAVPGNPWFGSAGEMVAISYLNMEKDDLAGPLFAQLAQDDNVPQTIRSRAVQMAGVQGIDAVDLNDEEMDQESSAPVAASDAEGETEE